MSIRRTLGRLLPIVVLSALALTACANPTTQAAAPTLDSGQSFDLSSKNVETRPHIQPVQEAVDALKNSGFQPIEAGYLTVATSAYTAPLGFAAEDDPSVLLGSEVDFAQLIADGLGLQLKIVNVAWADWPLGVQSGKYDLITSNVTVTEERKDLFDFATYREDVLGFAVKAGSPITEISKAADVAGLKVVVGSGTNQEKVLQAWDAENVANGLAPVEFVYYEDNAAANLALTSGRVDAYLAPNATLAFSAAATGETTVVGTLSGGWPETANIGAATAKDNGLIEPVSIVLNAAIAGGEYQAVIDRWALGAEAVDKAEINPPGLPRS